MLKNIITKLKRNYIFDDASRTVIIEGFCLVVKNPALHQGDIR